MDKPGDICREHKCGHCCDPVRVRKGFRAHIGEEAFQALPFEDLGEEHTPVDEHESVTLEAYRCRNYDPNRGECSDYENRPDICRNSDCRVFDVGDFNEQAHFIAEDKDQEFICRKK